MRFHWNFVHEKLILHIMFYENLYTSAEQLITLSRFEKNIYINIITIIITVHYCLYFFFNYFFRYLFFTNKRSNFKSFVYVLDYTFHS